MTRSRRPGRNPGMSGFTLLEMITVLVIMGIITAGIIPLYQGSLKRLRQEQAVRRLVALLRYAGEQAVITRAETRVWIDPSRGRYWLERQGASEQEQAATLPRGLRFGRLHARRDRRSRLFYVRFQPNGACDHARLRLLRGQASPFTVTVDGSVNRIGEAS